MPIQETSQRKLFAITVKHLDIWQKIVPNWSEKHQTLRKVHLQLFALNVNNQATSPQIALIKEMVKLFTLLQLEKARKLVKYVVALGDTQKTQIVLAKGKENKEHILKTMEMIDY